MTQDQIAVGQEVIVTQKGKMGRPKTYTGTVVSMNKTIFTIDTKGKLESFHWSDMTTTGPGKVTVELLAIGGDAMPHEPEKTMAPEAEQERPSALEGRKPATINPEFEQAVKEMESQAADPDDEPIPYAVVRSASQAEDTQEIYAPDSITDALAEIIMKFSLERERGYNEGYEAGRADAMMVMRKALEAC